MTVTNSVKKKEQIIEDLLFSMYMDGYFGYSIPPEAWKEEKDLMEKMSLTELYRTLYH